MLQPTTGLILSGAPTGSAQGGVVVTASGTPHAKGAWVTLVASTSADIGLVSVSNVDDVSGTAATSQFVIDLGVGAAASERVVAAGMIFSNTEKRHQHVVAVRIPAGSRVALRVQSGTASKAAAMAVSFGPLDPFGTPNIVTDYGFNTGTSLGTLLTTAGTVDVKSAWTQITASTTRPMRFVNVSAAHNSTAVSGGEGSIDVGYGPSSSERVILADAPFTYGANETTFLNSLLTPCNLPAGVRLAARYQYTNTGAGNAPLVVVHGMD